VQRWGSEQAPGSSVLLRTGALMSLASLGTAGLVLGGALAVGGPSGGAFPGAFGRGPTSVTVDETEQPTVLAAPSERRRAATPRAPRSSHPAAGREQAAPPAGRADDPLSGTTSSAARTPADLGSVARPARGKVVNRPSPALSSSPAPVVPALHAAPVGPAAAPAPTVPAPAAQAPQASRAAKAAQVAKASEAVQVAEAAQVAKVPNAPKAPKAAQVAEAPKAPKAAQTHKAPEPAPPAAAAPAQHGKGEHPKGEPPGQAKGNGSEH
jgi:translation initiation factor IF-2